jgi:hypothetical protein
MALGHTRLPMTPTRQPSSSPTANPAGRRLLPTDSSSPRSCSQRRPPRQRPSYCCCIRRRPPGKSMRRLTRHQSLRRNRRWPSPPVLVVPRTETAPVNEPPDVTAIVEPPPAQPDPTTTGGEPDLQRRPTTRAPISVQPEPRPLFPNQSPRGDGGQSPAVPSGLPGSPSQSDSHGHGPHR